MIKFGINIVSHQLAQIRDIFYIMTSAKWEYIYPILKAIKRNLMQTITHSDLWVQSTAQEAAG